MSKPSIKRTPAYNGQAPLDFGGSMSIPLTEKEQASIFLSKYQQVVHPLTKYSSYFSGGAKEIDQIFAEVKNFFTRLVLRGEWTERKYVAVINHIFEQKASLSLYSLDNLGRRYDENRLTPQNNRQRGI